ncbi:hypothetical protein HAHE_08770 [Haloferula helveola]|uniref:Uncharacterized protein n=1 Tax=Haloferula helveola TaxID=490095 RepID=A0ABN6H0B1_9BACT|nr:hypothetical protein HAHE_08770 [Haloferula helveola]
MKPARTEKQAESDRMLRGRRFSRFGLLAYAAAIVLAFYPGGAIAAEDFLGGGGVAETILPITFIAIGLGLHLGAIRYGPKSVGIWGFVAGLTLVPILAFGALLLSLSFFLNR